MALSGKPIDVSVPIAEGMPIYPGDPGVDIELAKSLKMGDGANVSRLTLGTHTGTHVDAPAHFILGGLGASQLPLEPFVGPCLVVYAGAVKDEVKAFDVDQLDIPADTRRVLFKTSNSALWERDSYVDDFVRLGSDAATVLVQRGMRLVGIDYLSIGDPDVHRRLLGAGVGVIEGLDLRGVSPGSYFLVCAPLKLAVSDGAPARTLLWPAPGPAADGHG